MRCDLTKGTAIRHLRNGVETCKRSPGTREGGVMRLKCDRCDSMAEHLEAMTERAEKAEQALKHDCDKIEAAYSEQLAKVTCERDDLIKAGDIAEQIVKDAVAKVTAELNIQDEANDVLTRLLDERTAERDALKSIMEREGLKGMANASLHIELDELKAKLAPLVEALEVVMHDNRGKNFEMAQSVLKEFKK